MSKEYAQVEYSSDEEEIKKKKKKKPKIPPAPAKSHLCPTLTRRSTRATRNHIIPYSSLNLSAVVL